MATLPKRPMGSQGLVTTSQGLGCMSLTPGMYQNKAHKDEDSIAVVNRAVELGVDFFDTMTIYGPFTCEILLGKAFAGKRDKWTIVDKWGPNFTDKGIVVDGGADNCKAAIEGSLERLGVDCIDLWIFRGFDSNTPVEETIGHMVKYVKEGKVKYLGLSEVGPDDIRRAHAVHPITAVELEWSLWSRDSERDLVPVCRELGIGIIAYSPLGRGFLTGQIKSVEDFDDGDFRKDNPRFVGEAFAKNLQLVENVKKLADKKGITPGQLALAWVHHQGEDVFPIPGTKQIKNLEENVAAAFVSLSEAEIKELEEAVPEHLVEGTRYPHMERLTYHGVKK